MRRKMLQSASPANLLSAAMEAKEFAEKLPGRVNKVMDALAEGQLTLNVQGIDERRADARASRSSPTGSRPASSSPPSSSAPP